MSDFLSGDFLTGDFIFGASTATTATSVGGFGKRRLDLRKWYQIKDTVRVFSERKRARELEAQAETLPYLERGRKGAEELRRANAEVSSYTDAQSRFVNSLGSIAGAAETHPVIEGYRRMVENGTLQKLARVNPVAHQALEREYQNRLMAAANARAAEAKARAMQI